MKLSKDLGITFVSLYLVVTGALAFLVALAFYFIGLHIIPFSFSLSLALVFLVYGFASMLAGYYLLKKTFFGWFTSVVLLSIQGLVFAFSFSAIPTLLAVAMLIYLVIEKDTFNVYAPVKVETTEAPKMPEMKFVIFEEEGNKFVKRKKR